MRVIKVAIIAEKITQLALFLTAMSPLSYQAQTTEEAFYCLTILLLMCFGDFTVYDFQRSGLKS